GGDAARAPPLCRCAVGAWPESVKARLQLGRAWAMQGQFREAAGELAKALELNPDSGAAHRSLGRLFRDIGDPYQAIGHYREALRIAPDQAEVRVELGQCLALAGRPDEARTALSEARPPPPARPVPMAWSALPRGPDPHAAPPHCA